MFKVLIRGPMVFSCSADKTARQHNAADRAQVRVFSGHTDWIYTLAVNEPTKRLATGSFDGEVRIWNLDDGAPSRGFQGRSRFCPARRAGGRREVARRGGCRFSPTSRSWTSVVPPVLTGLMVPSLSAGPTFEPAFVQ